MIINHPVLNRLSPSIKEIIPESGDDSLIVPNVFTFTGLPPEPIFLVGSSSNPHESSFGTGNSLTIANAGPVSITLATLRPGYWKIRTAGSYKANYDSILQAGDAVIILGSPSQGLNVMALYASSIGTQSFSTDFEILIQNNHTLSMQLSNNGVGQTHQLTASVICNRLL